MKSMILVEVLACVNSFQLRITHYALRIAKA